MYTLEELKSAVEQRADYQNHASVVDVANAMNAIDPQYTRIEPQIPIVRVAGYIAGGILGKLNQAYEDPNGDAGKRSVCGAALIVLQNRAVSVIDMRDPEVSQIFPGLVAYGVIFQEEADGFMALQNTPTSFAQFTWGCNVDPQDLLKACPGHW